MVDLPLGKLNNWIGAYSIRRNKEAGNPSRAIIRGEEDGAFVGIARQELQGISHDSSEEREDGDNENNEAVETRHVVRGEMKTWWTRTPCNRKR